MSTAGSACNGAWGSGRGGRGGSSSWRGQGPPAPSLPLPPLQTKQTALLLLAKTRVQRGVGARAHLCVCVFVRQRGVCVRVYAPMCVFVCARMGVCMCPCVSAGRVRVHAPPPTHSVPPRKPRAVPGCISPDLGTEDFLGAGGTNRFYCACAAAVGGRFPFGSSDPGARGQLLGPRSYAA